MWGGRAKWLEGNLVIPFIDRVQGPDPYRSIVSIEIIRDVLGTGRNALIWVECGGLSSSFTDWVPVKPRVQYRERTAPSLYL